MITRAIRLAMVVFALTPAAFAGNDLDDKVVEQLVRQLGDDDFAVREAATKKLEETGPLALPQLRAAMKSTDLEVRRRAAELVEAIDKRWTRLGHKQALWHVAVSPDGKRFVTSSADHMAKVWLV